MFTNNKLNKAVRLAMMFGAASTLAFAGAVAAQETSDKEDESAKKDEKAERIQVVGSRIRTDGLDSATPVTVISAELAKDQGLSTLGELLRTSTIAAGSSQLVSALSVGFVTAGGAGNESISMRGLGANRTLVLLNGRRAGPAGTRGQVAAFDLNSIPLSAVERVEVLKDGASSLYGSDAVAGVVNIITKKGDETNITVNLDQPFESGGENYRANATYGKTFDRGAFRAVVDYNLRTELARGDRDFFACPQRLFFDQATGVRTDPIDPRTGDYHCNALQYGVWVQNRGGSVPLPSNFRTGVRVQYDYDGFFAANNRPTFNSLITAPGPGNITVPAGWYPVSYDKETDGWADADHPFQDRQSMVPETEVGSVFLLGNYDFNDHVSGYSELIISRRTTTTNSFRQFWTAELSGQGFIRPGVIDGWGGSQRIGYMPVAMTDHSGVKTTVDYSRYVVGFEGSVGDWNWDVSYQNSYNRGDYDTKIILRDAMIMAQNAVYGGPCVGQNSPVSGKPCTLVDWLSPDHINGNQSQAVKNFLFDVDNGSTSYRQQTFDGYFTGELFELPAGFVSTAFGASLQKDEINDVPGKATLAGNLWGSTGAGVTAGSANTKAVYGEVFIPLLRDMPFVESFDLTASTRWTDVSTYGSDNTYKVSANWVIGHGFQLRASRGSSFRAPALFELYLQNQTGFLNQSGNDPCLNWSGRLAEGTLDPRVAANCQAGGVPDTYVTAGSSMTSVTGGGAGLLEAETSVSKGIGLVWKSPESTYGFSADYYDVVINGQVNNIGGGTVIGLCYRSENFPNDPFCNQFTRRTGVNGDWGIAEVRGGYVNVSQQNVRGADFMATYEDDFAFGRLRLRLDHTVQLERSFKQFPDSIPSTYVGDIGEPKHVGTLSATLSRDGWRYTWNTRYVAATDDYKYFANGNRTTYRGQASTFVADTPTYILHSASVQTDFQGFDVTFGIANLFDKEPPNASPSAVRTAGNAVLYSQYDFYGRRAFLNLSYNF
ncbi:TonB-dependent siderophore receptor [Alishewanella sp. HH-ZS]|uniref:TonB-dependent receptor plug domain-containing protein n=1 Tax=Alishewanella sp. HH-ZS TaxID=1856684 RepID=UPI0008235852|nr:TonB-dependent receptor [Alishewanella sp. HH-ZS]OCW97095.1 TonB-dependent receptor [Alishewanella sp. HH-ZS]